MATERRTDAFQFIFSLFVGVLAAVVVGVGVWTFYPPPYSENNAKQQELQKLENEQGRYYEGKPSPDELSPSEKAAYDKRQERIDEIREQLDREQKNWAVWTSIIVITIATILMAISLFLPEHAKVFSNGLLLGGLFTVLYGTGMSFTGGDSWARFWVVLTALLLALGIGYLRFMRGRQAAVVAVRAQSESALESGSGVTDIEARVSALEARLAALRSALEGRD